MRAKEFTPGTRDLIIFDIDDTLMHTTAKIKVLDANGKELRSLTNQEFNNYKLQPGEQFDFGEFRSAEKFRQESKPIVPMVRKLKTILNHAGNAKVIMLTARADFDDKEKFLQTFQDIGIDMSRVHVHRAGNLPGNEPPAYKKAVWVRKYLDTRQYGHVRLYDDSMSNLRVFKELKNEYPQVDFRAIYVGPEGNTQTVEDQHPNDRPRGPESKPTMPKGTVRVDVSDVYDWYKLGQHISDLKGLGKHDFGKGPPSTILSFGDEDTEHKYIKNLMKTGLSTTDIDPKAHDTKKGQKTDPTFNVDENFADGRNPQDKGDSKRYGVPTKASVSTLRKVAKQGGRKGQLAHWMANMKAGRAKKK